jgi:phospholipase A2
MEVSPSHLTQQGSQNVLLLSPGVERSPEELELGQLDIYGPKSPYATKELTYTEAAFDKLVKLSEYNIVNNKDTLLQALRLAVEKKKRQKSQCPS